jgi:hypothetical protein
LTSLPDMMHCPIISLPVGSKIIRMHTKVWTNQLAGILLTEKFNTLKSTGKNSTSEKQMLGIQGLSGLFLVW